MTVQEGLGALALIDAAEDRVGVHQRHDEQGHLGRDAFEDDLSRPEVDLGLARRVDQRYEHLAMTGSPVTDRLLDRRVPAGVPLLVPQPIEDPLGGVALLAVDLLVILHDLVDDPRKRADLGLGPFLALPVARWLAVGQHLAQRVPVNPELPENTAFAVTLDQYPSSNLRPLFHVRVHPYWPSLSRRPIVRSWISFGPKPQLRPSRIIVRSCRSAAARSRRISQSWYSSFAAAPTRLSFFTRFSLGGFSSNSASSANRYMALTADKKWLMERGEYPRSLKESFQDANISTVNSWAWSLG